MEETTQAVEVIRPAEDNSMQARARDWAAQAKAFVVTGPEQYERGIAAMQRIKRERKSWDAMQRPVIRAAKATHEAALKVFNSLDDEFDTAFETIKATCERWIEETREAQRRQLKAQAQTLTPTPAQTEAVLGPAFDAAVASGDNAKAARILDAAVVQQPPAMMPPPQAAAPYVPKVPGASVSVPYTYDVVDESLVPREYCMLDRKKVATVVKAMGKDTKIPGIVVRPDTSLSIRG